MPLSRTLCALAATLLTLLPGTSYAGPDRADFVGYYAAPSNSDYDEIRDFFQEERFLEKHLAELNKAIAFPRRMRVGFEECGFINAYYNPSAHQVVFCYELGAYLMSLFEKEIDDRDELQAALLGTVTFVLYHEFAHALIHVLDLPAVGREEDAADQLAAKVLLSKKDASSVESQQVLDAATWLYLQIKIQRENGATLDDMAFHDEHSMDEQRFYNLLCWAYGSDAKGFGHLVGDALPTARAERCSSEYSRVDRAWDRLLDEHLK